MKRCPKCNRAYSDIIEKCPQCNISLSSNPGTSTVQTNTTWVGQNPSQQNGTQPGSGYSHPPYNQIQGSQTQYNSNSNNSNGETGYIQPSVTSMGFIEAVKTCFMKYATFTGRARRSEYWYFCLFVAIVYALLSLFAQSSELMALVFLAWPLAIVVPEWAVCIRRLHDTGRDWKFIFWTFVPIYGPIKLIIELTKDSDPGHNWYGPCPK